MYKFLCLFIFLGVSQLVIARQISYSYPINVKNPYPFYYPVYATDMDTIINVLPWGNKRFQDSVFGEYFCYQGQFKLWRSSFCNHFNLVGGNFLCPFWLMKDTFYTSFNLSNSYFSLPCHIDDNQYYAPFWFTNNRVADKCDLTFCNYYSTADFSKNVFIKQINLCSSRFMKGLNFEQSTFSDTLKIDGIDIREVLNLSKISLIHKGYISFEKVSMPNYLDFSFMKSISGIVDLRTANYDKCALQSIGLNLCGMEENLSHFKFDYKYFRLVFSLDYNQSMKCNLYSKLKDNYIKLKDTENARLVEIDYKIEKYAYISWLIKLYFKLWYIKDFFLFLLIILFLLLNILLYKKYEFISTHVYVLDSMEKPNSIKKELKLFLVLKFVIAVLLNPKRVFTKTSFNYWFYALFIWSYCLVSYYFLYLFVANFKEIFTIEQSSG